MDLFHDVTQLLAYATVFICAVERLLASIWEPAHRRRLAIINAKRRPKK